ncbi:MAG: sigma-54 dependent transcriptional regulator [Candidatus Hydrogenedentes bacterium]|nr:sigma-54 dependent transcriptional regulator [Candidatus Hydrogenedentota bacterium]
MSAGKPQVLVVDDDEGILEVMCIILEGRGLSTVKSTELDDAIEKLSQREFDAVLTDLYMGKDKEAGIKLLRWVRQHRPSVPVVMITAYATVENAIQAMQEGAVDYIQKPFKSNEELFLRVKRAIERRHLLTDNELLWRERAQFLPFQEIIGESEPIKRLKESIRRIAPLSSTVLIYGESGVGKEVIAREIHELSPRANKKFVAINCGAIPETLLESELFGYKRGAFTGAHEDREGLLSLANGGTVFLDEIGEMPPTLQVKLLRVLDNKCFVPVGGSKEISVDIRVISATNKNLQELVKKGAFRQDLFYRLNVIPITVPPLRERVEDIPLLFSHFVKIVSAKMGLKQPSIAPEVMEVLKRYNWPGNVRELLHTVERILALMQGDTITLMDLPDDIRNYTLKEEFNDMIEVVLPEGKIGLEDYIADIEKRLIYKSLIKAKYSHKKAAEILGLTPRAFRYRLQKYGIKEGIEDLDTSEESSQPQGE